MNQLDILKGLIGKSIIQQVGISPSKPLTDFLSKNLKNKIFTVHNHHDFAKLLSLNKPITQYNSLVLEGADGQCISIIEGIARWLYRHENGEKMPRLIIIGFKDFKLPNWANFVHQPVIRAYNRKIITNTEDYWLDILKNVIIDLNKGGTIILVVPTEDDIKFYYNEKSEFARASPILSAIPADYPMEIVIWPNHPSDDKRSIFIVPGETDSKLWVNNVEVIIDMGIESHKILSPTGGEVDRIILSDRERINSRLLWLGYNREGKHIRLFEEKDVPVKNPGCAEIGSIFKLMNRMKNMTPEYKKYINLISEKRMNTAVSVLEGMKLETGFVENLNYSPQAIKIIQNTIKNKNKILGAVFLGCLIEFKDSIILWPNSSNMIEGDQYEKKLINFEYSIENIIKRSPLETYFSLMNDFFIISGFPKGNPQTLSANVDFEADFSEKHEIWLKEHSYINRNMFIIFLKCIKSSMTFLRGYGAILNYDYINLENGLLDENLIYEIQYNYKHRLLKHKFGQTYVDNKEREWIVDLRGSYYKNMKESVPETVYALSWKLNKFQANQMIVHLWY